MAEMKNGTDMLIHVKGKNPEQLVKEEYIVQDDGVEQESGKFEEFSAEFGRTISMGNYEFARVSFGARVSIPLPIEDDEREKIYKRLHDTVDEVLSREEACLRGNPYENREIDIRGLGKNAFVWLNYGMTFKGAGMDSNKVDVSASRYVDNADGDIEAVIIALGDEVGKRLNEYRDRVVAGDPRP